MTTFPSQRPAYANRYAKLHRSGYRLTVPAIGPARRLRALHAIGYSRTMLSELTGLGSEKLRYIATERAKRVRRADAEVIARVYESRWDKPLFSQAAYKARTNARNKGWAPPLSWSDIDNPHERAHGLRMQIACDGRTEPNRYHPEGRICGWIGPLRKGKCRKHYDQMMRERGAA